ncbi:hypothetical protein BDZ45DRAFT_799863 [Acephala macrosclerotiorum]|nr:hypothetical protein BDZ45DRAFT_799863 [Acephala macrosclerotiorum]
MLRHRIDENLPEYETDDIAVGSLVRDMRDPLGTLIYQAKLGPAEYAPPEMKKEAVLTDTFTRRSFWTRREYIYRYHITTPRVKTIICADTTRLVRSLLQLEHSGIAKARLDAFLEKKEVYVIMGYKAISNPTIEIVTGERFKSFSIFGGAKELPISEVEWPKTGSTAADLPMAGIGGSWLSRGTTSRKLNGEYIWEVQYLPVRFTAAAGEENWTGGEPIYFSTLKETSDPSSGDIILESE